MASFIIPRELYYGAGAISELAKLKGKKATIVIGGGSIKKSGNLDRIIAQLAIAGIETQVVEGVEHDPSVKTVLAGAKQMQEFGPDLIVGVGGGSPIDAAKAMWLFYEYPEHTFDEASVPFTLPQLRRKARFVAVPTTSGTGTEVTSFAVITDQETGIKYPIADYNLTPDVAILDPEMAADMPAQLVAHTGMDALAHAFEAFASNMATDITDALAIKSIEMIDRYLIDAYKGSKEARGKMHTAQCLAGMAFSNAILGIVHSMAHKSGHILDVPHGCANGIYLPHVIAFNAETAPEKYVAIADRLKLSGGNDKEKIAALITYINELNKKLGIPATLKAQGVDESLFNSNWENMAETAVADPCTGTNPRAINVNEMRALFKVAYYGN